MKPLDGHVNRVMSGKTVDMVTKDGTSCTFHMTSGELFELTWADENGDSVKGEPILVRVNVRIALPAASASSAVGSI